MRNILQEFERYLRDTLSILTTPEGWEDADRLPFYLRDLYTFFKGNILSVPYLLMVDRGEVDATPANIRKHLVQVQDKWKGEIIYLREAVSPYNRKRLIENRIPFVIPGNQMYLPMLGIDLREHFRKTTSASHVLSPSTQAMLLYTLLKGDQATYNPSTLASLLGYSPMTMTRAFGELEAADLGEISTVGRERLLYLGKDKKGVWEKAQALLRSPAKKRMWIRHSQAEWPGLKAGLTALAHYTMLAAPASPVYAVSEEEWKAIKQSGAVVELESPWSEPGLCELEIWSYSPRLLSESDVVDRLSLFLSLPNPQDERVESALEKMIGALAW